MRVKRGTVSRNRHNKVLKATKGFRGRRKSCYKIAKNALEKSMQYAYRDRKAKKRDFRKLWIIRINAAARLNGMSYSQFINGLNKADIEVNRKVLADLAVHDPSAFTGIAEQARAAL